MLRTLHHHTVVAHLDDLIPTQCSVGYWEVHNKVLEWQSLPKKARKEVLTQHWFPCVMGPGQKPYIVDHHHLGLALHHVGQRKVFLMVLSDWSHLEESTFWRMMEFHQWVYPFNEKGRRVPIEKLPAHVSLLKDDPYRSLAGLVRKAGGFAKDTTPFSEFLWAEHFRTHLPISKTPQWPALTQAGVALALSADASYLPGWVGLPHHAA